jgi:glycosyltransferase involved in cell wall biosynthesis
MNSPIVTVVVPAFNAGSWIEESLSSVLAQSYPKDSLEIVVVDDGSTDGSANAAERIRNDSASPYTVIRNPSPTGPSAARNRGWRAGRGQWLQFLDADDRLDPGKIALQTGAASGAHPEIAALHSPWARLVAGDNGRWVTASPWVHPHTGEDPLVDLLRTDNFMQLGCLLFSRTWLERVNGFDESIRFIEDVDLLLRLTMSGGALQSVPSAQPLSWYRQHPASLSKSDDNGFVEGCVRNARLVEHHWRDGTQLTPARRRALASIYFMGAHFFSGRDADTFEALVRDLYRLEPDFVPDGPRALRLLTRLFGYPRAERCAVQYRRFKRSIRPQASA